MLPNRRKQINANIAQSVECSLGKAEVTGSIPVVSSKIYRKLEFLENSSFFAILRRESKRRIRKASSGRFSRRGSSNPFWSTIKCSSIWKDAVFLFLFVYYWGIRKEDSETSILVDLFNFINYGILDANRWKNIAPEAWKNKIKNYIELGL